MLPTLPLWDDVDQAGEEATSLFIHNVPLGPTVVLPMGQLRPQNGHIEHGGGGYGDGDSFQVPSTPLRELTQTQNERRPHNVPPSQVVPITPLRQLTQTQNVPPSQVPITPLRQQTQTQNERRPHNVPPSERRGTKRNNTKLNQVNKVSNKH